LYKDRFKGAELMTPTQEIKQQAQIDKLKHEAKLTTQTFDHGLRSGRTRAECAMRMLDLIEWHRQNDRG
jgi:hypothetical protein